MVLAEGLLAAETGVSAATVSRHLKAEGLGRLWRIEEAENPPQRYEHAYAGSLFHVDAKRFGRIDGVGHAIHGDRSRRSRGVGWEVVFVCVDDYSRLAYAEVHPSENTVCAVRFFRRALRWFESLGVRCKRVLTDNAKCYSSKAFTALCDETAVRQSFTRPYTPRTNGKAERFIQTLKRRWAYRHPLPNLRHPSGLASTLGHPLQSPATPSSDRQDPADRPAQSITSVIS